MTDEIDPEDHRFEAGPDDQGARLDRFLADRLPDWSRTALVRQIRMGYVTVNDRAKPRPRPAHRIEPGDRIHAALIPARDPIATPESIDLVVLHEDAFLVVIDKPPGLTVHPGNAAHSGTLANALTHHFSKLSSVQGPGRPGIVHRLDKETSGLILIAKDDSTHRKLAAQFKERTIEKEYLTVVRGVPELDADLIDAPLGPNRRYPTRQAIRIDIGKESQTLYQVLERFESHAWVRCRPRTGRTHQIRVHLRSIGHPVLGDRLYGGVEADLYEVCPRQALHAHRLTFMHPGTEERTTLEAPIPADIQALLDRLRGGHTPEDVETRSIPG